MSEEIVKSVWKYFEGIEEETYYEVGKKDVVKIEKVWYSPAPQCGKLYFVIYFEDKSKREMHEFTEIAYFSEALAKIAELKKGE